MTWNSWEEFIHMGGYGLYVWSSYGVTLAVMVVEPLLAHFSKRIFHVGPDEQARTLKLVINLMITFSPLVTND